MAEASDVNRLRGFLECSICLEKYDNPKPLTCTHHFCKQCLEDIMTFNEDGSALIDCPMRCAEQTVLANDKTVNDLVASYDFLGLLEALKTKDEKSDPLCKYEESCTKEVTVCCCETLMCSPCLQNHTKMHRYEANASKATNLFFNMREKKLKVLCDIHGSQCTHVCQSHRSDIFLCKYCLHRDRKHENHQIKTVEENVEMAKGALSYYSKQLATISPFVKTTTDNVRDIRSKVHDLLDLRYEVCLTQYTDFLKKKKEHLKDKLKGIIENHMVQYRFIPKYYDENIEKNDIVLAMQRGTILDTINTTLKKLKCETLCVNGKCDFLSEDPLGDIKVTTDKEVLISSSCPPLPTLKLNLNAENEQSQSSGTGCSTFKDRWSCSEKSLKRRQDSNEDDDEEEDGEEDDDSVVVSEHDEYCAVCNGEGTLILCDECPRSYHFGCCYPQLKKVPRGNWSCQICTGKYVLDKELYWRKRAKTLERNREQTVNGFAPPLPQNEIPKATFNFGLQPATPSFGRTPASPAFGTTLQPALGTAQPFGIPNAGAGGRFTIGSGTSNPPIIRQTLRARRKLTGSK